MPAIEPRPLSPGELAENKRLASEEAVRNTKRKPAPRGGYKSGYGRTSPLVVPGHYATRRNLSRPDNLGV